MNDESSEEQAATRKESTTALLINRFGGKIGRLASFISSIKTLLALGVVVLAIVVVIYRGDGARLMQHWHQKFGSLMVPEYKPLTSLHEHSFIATQGILEAKGLHTSPEEFTFWRDKEKYHYRWQRNDQVRDFSAFRDAQGIWIVNEEE